MIANLCPAAEPPGLPTPTELIMEYLVMRSGGNRGEADRLSDDEAQAILVNKYAWKKGSCLLMRLIEGAESAQTAAEEFPEALVDGWRRSWGVLERETKGSQVSAADDASPRHSPSRSATPGSDGRPTVWPAMRQGDAQRWPPPLVQSPWP